MILKDIQDIIEMCKKAGCSQKTVQYSVYVYKMYLLHFPNKNHKRNDLISSSISLGCKISDYIIDISTSNESIELEMCVSIDFDFNIKDIYKRVEYFINKYNIKKNIAQYLWILINDSMYLPLKKESEKDNLIIGCIHLSYIINKIIEENDTRENDIKENDTRENDTRENDTRENDTRENDTREHIPNLNITELNIPELNIPNLNGHSEQIINELLSLYEND
jgi:hypothetical protein